MDAIPPVNPGSASNEPSPSGNNRNWVYVVAFLAACATFGAGMYLGIQDKGWAVLAAGCACVVGVLAAWPLASLLGSSGQAAQGRQENVIASLNDRLLHIATKLDTITEQQLVSDRAKAVAYRDKDRDALRKAIRQDLDRKDWEGALVLADIMEREFGYKQEADAIRVEINAHRADVIGKMIMAAAQTIDKLCRGERWNEANRAADKLIAQFPDNEQVNKLPQEIDTRRQQHKKQLIDSWHDAVSRKDVDGGLEILKKMDPYLTAMEAAAIQESARNMFKEKLHALSAQFEQWVKDHKWNEAIRVGDQIMRDFPNSGIAGELRERMDSLRQRLAGEAAQVARV